jgi:hypothetical protein
MLKKLIFSISIFSFFLTVFSLAKGSLTVDEFNQGRINWEAGIVKAKGGGAPPSGIPLAQARFMARRAAIVDAYRNLAEIVYGVRVDSETVVKNFVTESDVIKTKVEGIIRGARIISEKELPDGSYEVIVVMPLYGKNSVAKAILPPAVQKQEKKFKKEGIKITPLPPPPEEPLEGSYTGIIIDATDVGARPSMSPKIIAENGDITYGVIKIDADVAIEKGIVGYYKSLSRAKKSWRAGSRPLIIKAKDVVGSYKADVIISNSDAERILRANKKAGFLQNLKVAIVT